MSEVQHRKEKVHKLNSAITITGSSQRVKMSHNHIHSEQILFAEKVVASCISSSSGWDSVGAVETNGKTSLYFYRLAMFYFKC